MSDRPLWFDGSIIGAIFALVVLPASADSGTFLLNLIALACFVAPIVFAVRDGDLRTSGDARDFSA